MANNWSACYCFNWHYNCLQLMRYQMHLPTPKLQPQAGRNMLLRLEYFALIQRSHFA